MLIRISLELLPLSGKQILLEFIEPDFIGKLYPCLLKGVLPAQAQVIRPLDIALSAVFLFHCGIKCIIRKPFRIVTDEIFQCLACLVVFGSLPFSLRHKRKRTVLISLLQQRKTLQINSFIIYLLRIISEGNRIRLFSGKISSLKELLQIDKIRISRKRRKGLVRRISVSRLSKRQNLPVGLPCCRKEINKLICLSGKTTDSVFRRKRCNRKQYSAFSFHFTIPLLFFFLYKFAVPSVSKSQTAQQLCI